MSERVELDGSLGEGGGQILRTALSLSLITGKPFHIRNLRAGRAKPGLAPQHLTAVRACAAIGDGDATGAQAGSTALEFRPGAVAAGNYRFDIGTAGSTTLLLQTLIWPLALQARPSSLTLLGGTHVPSAPTFEYLSQCWAPTIRRLGIGLSLRMPRAGFYPKGGGELRVTLHGSTVLHGVRWDTPVMFDAFTGLSAQAGLTEDVAARQAAGARTVLEAAGIYCPMSTATLSAASPGTAIALVAGSRSTPVCATAIGERGKRAETVGQAAAKDLVRLVQARAPVDPHGVDQLLLPLALAREASSFLTSWATEHLRTNAGVIERFLSTRITIEPELHGRALVRVEPHAEGSGR